MPFTESIFKIIAFKLNIINICNHSDEYFKNNQLLANHNISIVDFKKILNFAMNLKYKQIKRIKNSFCFLNNKYNLPKTVSILNIDNKYYSLIIETRHTNSANKENEHIGSISTFKKINIGLMISANKVQLLASSVQTINLKNYNAQEMQSFIEIEKFNNAINEIKISRQVSNLHVLRYHFGNCYKINNKLFVTAYSSLMDCDLAYYVYKHIDDNTYSQQSIKFIQDIINGLKAIHGFDYVHQDIKPNNILVKFSNNKNKLHHALVCDLNLTKKEHVNIIPETTYGYESPEIFSVHKWLYDRNKKNNHKYYEKNNSIGKLMATNDNFKNNIQTPHKASDIWALGITILYMIFNEHPNNTEHIAVISNILSKSKFLSHCLQLNYNNRSNIDIAEKLFQQDNSTLLKIFNTKKYHLSRGSSTYDIIDLETDINTCKFLSHRCIIL